MSEKKYISAVIETTLELDCDREFIEQEELGFVVELVENGSFEYTIRKPVYDSRGVFDRYETLEKGNIGFGLARLLKKYSLIAEIIERLSHDQAFHDIADICDGLSAIGFD